MFRILSRNLSLLPDASVKLVGRDFIAPSNLTSTDLKSLLWTALDIRLLSKTTTIIDKVKNARISFIFDEPCAKSQLPIQLAAKLLHITPNIIIDNTWKKDNFVNDFGRLMAVSSDMIFCKVKEQNLIEQIADGADIPVIAINSSTYSLIKTLADLLTIYIHYNKLKSLTVAWIGKQEPLFNTYILTLPQLNMNMKYCMLQKDFDKSVIQVAHKYSQTFNTEIHQYDSPHEAIYGSNIITTSAHNLFQFQISENDMKEAANNWTFLHELPRGEYEVKKDLFSHENSLAWNAIQNMQWIYAAIMVRFLVNHNHTLTEPQFDRSIYDF